MVLSPRCFPLPFSAVWVNDSSGPILGSTSDRNFCFTFPHPSLLPGARSLSHWHELVEGVHVYVNRFNSEAVLGKVNTFSQFARPISN